MASLPYHEPGILTILSLASFLLALNGFRYVLNRFLSCGILGEIFVGVVWGAPLGGTSWLSQAVQETVQALGYLGLIGLVFEGGLTSSPSGLRKSALLSISIATVGLCLPIALAFLLVLFPFSDGVRTVYPTPLAAFSAGASLCSTSLGTTFAVLTAAGLQKTGIGVVLVGAAMMDDVVGLVMVKIITALGSGSISAWGIARPVLSSCALLLVTITVTPWIFRPVFDALLQWLYREREAENTEKTVMQKYNNLLKWSIRRIPHVAFISATLVLVAFVTIAAYIEASNLFAAFVAGGVVRTLDEGTARERENEADEGVLGSTRSVQMYERYYQPVLAYLLTPFFFASIGFAIPIHNMFDGPTVWKGFVYALMMLVAKAAVGLVIYGRHFFRKMGNGAHRRSRSSIVEEPVPHIPALVVSLAMIARGEIGCLIASLSSSAGTLTTQPAIEGSSASEQDIFLVIMWAVMLCTLVGPIGLGFVVTKHRRNVAGNPSRPPSEARNMFLALWA